MAGTALFTVPASILDPNASDEEKASLEEVKRIGRNWNKNEQAFIVMPSAFDDQNNKLYDLQLMGVQGGKTYDVSSVIKRFNNEILTGLFADMLVLSQNSQGSFALAEAFAERQIMAIQAYLNEIADVINSDLIRHTFALNGWDDERLPTITFEDIDEVGLEEYSKAIQRIKSVGLITKTAKNINHIAEQLDLPDRVADDIEHEELMKLLGEETSRAGDGFEKGSGNGTSDSAASTDTSSNNLENNA